MNSSVARICRVAAALFVVSQAGTIGAAVAPDRIAAVRALLDEHRFKDAETAAKALATQNPNDASAQGLLGVVYLTEDNAEPAVAALETAVSLAPSDAELQRQLGEAYGLSAQKAGMLSRIGFAKKCRLAFEKAVELDPKSIPARLSLMGFYQQAPGLMGGGMDKARAQAAEIVKLDQARGRLALASLDTSEQKYTDAFAELAAARAQSSDNYAVLYQIGRLAAMSGDHVDDGLAALQKCLTLPPPADAPKYDAVHWRLGNLWEAKGDAAKARAEYQAALAVDPKFQQAIDSLKKLK